MTRSSTPGAKGRRRPPDELLQLLDEGEGPAHRLPPALRAEMVRSVLAAALAAPDEASGEEA